MNIRRNFALAALLLTLVLLPILYRRFSAPQPQLAS